MVPDSITCPRCDATSYHPTDVAERYCGRCHRFIDDETGTLTMYGPPYTSGLYIPLERTNRSLAE